MKLPAGDKDEVEYNKNVYQYRLCTVCTESTDNRRILKEGLSSELNNSTHNVIVFLQ